MPLKFISAKTPDQGIQEMATRITRTLNDGRKVLWLICGGSNIPLAVAAMEQIRWDVEAPKLGNLTIAQTDERYGPTDYADANWKQMLDSGFQFLDVKTIPILINESLEETIARYTSRIDMAMNDTEADKGLIIAQFGIGADGHIAGMLPHSAPVSDPMPVAGYNAGQFTRLTLTPPALKRINAGYVFVFGGGKADALNKLRDQELSIDDEPCQILKQLKEAYLYTDQI